MTQDSALLRGHFHLSDPGVISAVTLGSTEKASEHLQISFPFFQLLWASDVKVT